MINHGHPFRAAFATRDLAAWSEELAEDVVTFSPMLRTPFEGKETLTNLYRVLFSTFEDFEITDEFVSGDRAAFFWVGKMKGRAIHGADLVRTNAEGRVCEITVLIRPLLAIADFAAATGPAFARRLGRLRSCVARLVAGAASDSVACHGCDCDAHSSQALTRDRRAPIGRIAGGTVLGGVIGALAGAVWFAAYGSDAELFGSASAALAAGLAGGIAGGALAGSLDDWRLASAAARFLSLIGWLACGVLIVVGIVYIGSWTDSDGPSREAVVGIAGIPGGAVGVWLTSRVLRRHVEAD